LKRLVKSIIQQKLQLLRREILSPFLGKKNIFPEIPLIQKDKGPGDSKVI
jgi:hypothetical protein